MNPLDMLMAENRMRVQQPMSASAANQSYNPNADGLTFGGGVNPSTGNPTTGTPNIWSNLANPLGSRGEYYQQGREVVMETWEAVLVSSWP